MRLSRSCAVGLVALLGLDAVQIDLPVWATYPRWNRHAHLQPVEYTLQPEQSTGQGQEDLYAMQHFFHNMANGTFLELGALDGLSVSNTKSLEDFMGWRGVLIEASPANHVRLVGNRPNAIRMHSAVCREDAQVHYMELDDQAVKGIYEFMAPSFMQRWHPDFAQRVATDPSVLDELPVVHCLPLWRILQLLHIEHINFFEFDVVVVEADEHSAEKNEAVRKLFVSNGYIYHGNTARNDWFVHAAFLPSEQH
eukprot:TRINITY_DN4657_c0_g1_i3.p1 TRINITY_DN4657_c0_g1~~TRINITY_DN4657_c0_g1_i3.p1  ORF type:complete len:252 (-),score=57.56 TRINITY_DN4657_c0_g1_i3:141-896(-)